MVQYSHFYEARQNIKYPRNSIHNEPFLSTDSICRYEAGWLTETSDRRSPVAGRYPGVLGRGDCRPDLIVSTPGADLPL